MMEWADTKNLSNNIIHEKQIFSLLSAAFKDTDRHGAHIVTFSLGRSAALAS